MRIETVTAVRVERSSFNRTRKAATKAEIIRKEVTSARTKKAATNRAREIALARKAVRACLRLPSKPQMTSIRNSRATGCVEATLKSPLSDSMTISTAISKLRKKLPLQPLLKLPRLRSLQLLPRRKRSEYFAPKINEQQAW